MRPAPIEVRKLCETMSAYYQQHGEFSLKDVENQFPGERQAQRERFLRCVSKGYWMLAEKEYYREKMRFKPGPLLLDVLNTLPAGCGGSNPRFPFPVPDLCSFFKIRLPDDFYRRLYPASRVHRESWE